MGSSPTRLDEVLAKRKILVVEDNYFIAEDVCDLLRDHGAEIVGPAANVEQGLALAAEADGLDCAVLDLNLNGQSALQIATMLAKRNVGFVFVTGYDKGGVPPELEDVPRIVKPFDGARLCRAVREQVQRARHP